MILQQQIRVLPAGAKFIIKDCYKEVLNGYISQYDKSVCFNSIEDSELYFKVYQCFHVDELDVSISDGNVIYLINVR